MANSDTNQVVAPHPSDHQVELIQHVTTRLFLSLILLIAVGGAMHFSKLIPTQVSVWAVVIGFGVCGGFISVQRRLKALTTEDLELIASSWPYVFLSPLVGGVLATILYMAFASGLLAGDIFPKFLAGDSAAKGISQLFNCVGASFADYGKLIFWSFVAGFSESFVTDIIGSFAKDAPSHHLNG